MPPSGGWIQPGWTSCSMMPTIVATPTAKATQKSPKLPNVANAEAEAFAEFEKFMRGEAMSALDKGYSDGSNVIPFRRR